jgi:hypothetical protein
MFFEIIQFPSFYLGQAVPPSVNIQLHTGSKSQAKRRELENRVLAKKNIFLPGLKQQKQRE